jgi:hypothetical protein
MKFGFERTPLAYPLLKQVRADIKAGGARRDLALARMSMGSMVMAVAGAAAAQGYITGGGPSDPAMAAAWRRQGFQPYSIKIGDKWISYGRIEPLGMVFGLAADFATITGMADETLQPEMDDLAIAIVASISKNVTSKTFLRGLSEAIQAMENPDWYGERWIGKYVGTAMPTLGAHIERTMDPEFGQAENIMDYFIERTPGWSKSLPPRRDFWGQPITAAWSQGGKRSWAEIAYSFVSPFYISEGKESPIDKEIMRLKLNIRKPTKSVTIDGQDIPLDPWEYDRYQVLVNEVKVKYGKNMKDALNYLVQTPGYQRMTRNKKEAEIREIVTDAKEDARDQLEREFPILRDVARELKKQEVVNPEY